MAQKPQNVRGMRDHLPADMVLRQHIIATLTWVFERHGFEPLATAIVEHAETLEGKIGDDEKLIFRFEYGDRKLALRYDQTVPLARVVAQYAGQISLPWRRYAIGPSYRGERPGRGRYRELWQADVDIVGSASPLADAEIIALLDEALRALGFNDFTTLLNHRQVLGGIARASGLPEDQAAGVYRAIDKLDKIGPDGVRAELAAQGVAVDAIERMLELVLLDGAPGDVLEALTDHLRDDPRAYLALENLRAVLEYLPPLGVPAGAVVVAPRLARGLSYYTGAVFESVVQSPPMGSLLGGGRYDDLIGTFAGRPIPTVGLAFGIERLHDVMQELGMGPRETTIARAYITLFSPELAGAALALAHELRAAGVPVITALDPRQNLSKQLKEADQKGVRFALLLGPDELARGEVMVKNLRDTTQQTVARAALAGLLRGEASVDSSATV